MSEIPYVGDKMRKLLFMMTIFLGFIASSFAVDLSKDKYLRFEFTWDSSYFLTPEAIYRICWEGSFYEKLSRSNFRLDENGWFYYDEIMFIPELAVKLGGNCKNNEYAQMRGYFYNPWFKVTYSASSSLSENTRSGFVVYSAENLGTFAFAPTDHYESLSWNYDHIPWVEGESGYGIGTVIKMTSENPFKKIMILNGYVDAKKPELYRKNSRVKAFFVRDLDNGNEYTFELEDCVCFQFFNLNHETKKLELKIAEVYKGDKWEDTCVSAIVPESHNDGTEAYPAYQKYSCFDNKEDILKLIDLYTSEYKFRKYEPDTYK